MAQKEDVLEQVVDDYLQQLGYFTRHNIRYRPDARHPDYVKIKDSNYSDIDVLGLHPLAKGVYGQVVAVSCKSWMYGFDPVAVVRDMTAGKAEFIGYFRELWVDKWAGAFRAKLAEVTGTDKFTYLLAVTRLLQPVTAMRNDPTIQSRLAGNRFEGLELADIWRDVYDQATTTLASSDIGRLAQLLKASRVFPSTPAPPTLPVAGSVNPPPATPPSGPQLP